MAAFKKIQIGFDDQAYERLQRLKRRTGAITMAEVVRHALGLYEWALSENAKGRTVGSSKDGVEHKEILLSRGMDGVR